MPMEASSHDLLAAAPAQQATAQGAGRGLFAGLGERAQTERTQIERTQAERGRSPTGGLLKRTVDLCLASTAIVALSPFLALCALGVAATSGASPIYRHRRVGFGGETFDCLKFRTMTGDGESALRAYFDANPDARAEWEATRKLRDDPRVTRFGRILRKTSVDELPQLFNVVRGEMSLVGPRPVVEQELARYGARRAAYVRCRPGLTGLWQTSGRSRASYAKRVACDACYARNWRLALDVLIIMRTLPALFGSDDAC
ncbi:sugar transferase [Methylocella sp.]|uniref:sugar transferase n=1 Tax=Methylocella sp. TaxID=1978226 RepID=UPI003784804C